MESDVRENRFAVLTDGARYTPVDMRLYLPQRWIDDPANVNPLSHRARARIAVQGDGARGAGERALPNDRKRTAGRCAGNHRG